MEAPRKTANVQPKSNSLQTYQLILYNRALHPELFPLRNRVVVGHDSYELEAWVMPGSHMLRFGHASTCLCELVTDQESDLPDTGVEAAFFCAGEHEYDQTFEKDQVLYMASVQTETLSENLYLATYEELLAFGREMSALSHVWETEAGPCLSMVDIQRYNREIHAQAYHLLAQGGLVLRSQTLFELTT